MAARHSLLCMAVYFLSMTRTLIMDAVVTPVTIHCSFSAASSGISAKCSDLHLTTVPQYLPHQLSVLDLSFNSLRALRNQSLQRYPELKILNCRWNHIQILESGVFHTLEQLQILDLSSNQIREIPSLLFDRSFLLLSLFLANNKITEIPNAALHSINELVTVNLNNNSISTLDFEAFSQWDNMQVIDVSRNNVSSLHQLDFQPLQNCSIYKFILSSNRITSLPAKVFLFLSPVQRLYLNILDLHMFEVQSFMGRISIEQVSLYSSNISEIIPLNKSHWVHDDFPNIQALHLLSNKLSKIPDYAFLGFQHLLSLDLSLNHISSITNVSFCGLDSLTDLNLSRNKIFFIPLATFSCIQNIVWLSLAFNKIAILDPQYFTNCKHLTHLDLYQNNIYEIRAIPWTTTSLQQLFLSQNLMKSVTGDSFDGLENLKELNFSDNNLRMMMDPFKKLVNLETLSLQYQTEITIDGSLKGMSHLCYLDVSYLVLHMESVYQFMGNSSLRELKMKTARVNISQLIDISKQTNVSLFWNLTHLETLVLTGNNLTNLFQFPWIFAHLSNLKLLDLSVCEIVVLQSEIFHNLTCLKSLILSGNYILKIGVNTFNGLNSIQSLFLQYNNIRAIDKDLLEGTPNLKKLYLQGNHITSIAPHTTLPESLVWLDVSKNPFTCTCSLAWFREWLQNMNVALRSLNETLCSSSSLKQVINKPLLDFQPDNLCAINISLITSVTFTAVLVGCLCVIAYNKRWWINYKFFLLRLAIVGYEEIRQEYREEDYEYQLNIMFHDGDEQWVNNTLKPVLEERLPHLSKILYGDDDLDVGMFYINAIYQAIESSFKTVLVISNRSVDDAWFMTKLRMALEHLNETRLDKIILVFVEDIEDERLPYLVRLFLSKNRPHMKWTDDMDGQELFWAKFEKSMRSNRVISHVIPV